MNKLTKGSLAAGAGLILLLGGTGTFMSWNDTEAITAGPVTAGHLRLTPVGDSASWTVNDVAVPGNTITDFRIVPGDKVVYTTDLRLEAEGDNLTADLNLSEGAIATGTSTNPRDLALAEELSKTAVLELDTIPGTIEKIDEDSYRINAGTPAGKIDETVQVTVTLDFTFDKDDSTTDDEAAMNGQVDLSGMSVNLTQNLNPAA